MITERDNRTYTIADYPGDFYSQITTAPEGLRGVWRDTDSGDLIIDQAIALAIKNDPGNYHGVVVLFAAAHEGSDLHDGSLATSWLGLLSPGSDAQEVYGS